MRDHSLALLLTVAEPPLDRESAVAIAVACLRRLVVTRMSAGAKAAHGGTAQQVLSLTGGMTRWAAQPWLWPLPLPAAVADVLEACCGCREGSGERCKLRRSPRRVRRCLFVFAALSKAVVDLAKSTLLHHLPAMEKQKHPLTRKSRRMGVARRRAIAAVDDQIACCVLW